MLDQSREAADRFRAEEMERARGEAEAFIERAHSDIQRERDAAIQEVRANFGDFFLKLRSRTGLHSPRLLSSLFPTTMPQFPMRSRSTRRAV